MGGRLRRAGYIFGLKNTVGFDEWGEGGTVRSLRVPSMENRIPDPFRDCRTPVPCSCALTAGCVRLCAPRANEQYTTAADKGQHRAGSARHAHWQLARAHKNARLSNPDVRSVISLVPFHSNAIGSGMTILSYARVLARPPASLCQCAPLRGVELWSEKL